MAKKMNYDRYREEWAELYNEGSSIRQIALQYGVNKGSVALQIKKVLEVRPKSIHKDKASEFYKYYLEGYSIYEISKHFDIAYSTVSAILLSEYQIGTDDKNKKYADLKPMLIKGYKNGKSLHELSKEYGISKQCISNYIKEDSKLRTYEESSRTYEMNDDYFDSLDSKKSYYLGVIFASGNIYKVNTSRFVNLTMRAQDKEILLATLRELSDKDANALLCKDKSDSLYARVNSSKLCNELESMGLGKRLPLDKENLNIKRFFEGYFEVVVSIQSRGVHMLGRSDYNNQIELYLRALGMKANRRTLQNKICIQRMKDLQIYLSYFPFLIKRIETYMDGAKKTSNHWEYFFKKYM